MLVHRNHDFSDIRRLAHGRWPDILAGLGIDRQFLHDKHSPCPGCGGKDRFRFDDKTGDGGFICGQGGDPLAGDGIALLGHFFGWSPRQSFLAVAEFLGMDGSSAVRPMPPVPRKPAPKPTTSTTQKYAAELWLGAIKDDATVAGHDYARRKGITWAAGAGRTTASGSRIGKNADVLVVPIRSTETKKLIGAECINPAGVKQSFGSKSGALVLGNDLDHDLPIFIFEGWSSAVAWTFQVHAGNACSAVAFGKSRMRRAAEDIAEKYQSRVVIMEEDDG